MAARVVINTIPLDFVNIVSVFKIETNINSKQIQKNYFSCTNEHEKHLTI